MNVSWRMGLLGAMLIVLLRPCPAAAESEKNGSTASYYAEQMALESARYLFDIEGDTVAANDILHGLQKSARGEIQVQAHFLEGRFFEEAGHRDKAIRSYTQALGGKGLSTSEKRKLVARLLALNPGALQPLRTAGKGHGLPVKYFAAPEGTAMRYVLVEESDNPDTPPRLSSQDAEGMLHSMNVTLNSGEDVLDATSEAVLTVVRAKAQVLLHKSPSFSASSLSEKFLAEEGLIFSGESEEFLLMGAQSLRLMRHGQTVFSHTLPGPGCSYRPSAPRSRQGIVFCPDHGIFRADFSRRSMSPLLLGGDVPSEVTLSGDYLAIRYVDHIEIRRGPSFDAFLWGFPSGMQDQLSLGRSHAFLVGGEGQLRAFDLRTGQLDWQRDEDIAEVHPSGREVFALTHDQTCLALDEKGQTLFTYEAGWGSDPLLLPTQDWLVLQQANGHRVRLNRELLRLTGGDRGYLFQKVEESLKRHDSPGSLNALNAVLALEPGNGVAWREKAQLLRLLPSSKKEQTEAWLQAGRSRATAAWSDDPVLRNLARNLGASWIWKRHAGPRFFPTLNAGRRLSYYVENDNQTLALLDNETGVLQSSFHFPEPLDLKATGWSGDTVILSSPNRIYLLGTTSKVPGILSQIPLRSPICQAMVVPGGLVYSDWNGTLQFVELPSRHVRWELHLGRSGLLLARNRVAEFLDVFEIEGGYHNVKLSTGRDVNSFKLPPGTITECYAGRDFAYAGYNEGLLIAVDRNRGTLAWQKDLGEQIFSLAGKAEALLIGTASKRILSIEAGDGHISAETHLPTYLFNRPLMVEDGYWVGTTEPALEKRSLNHALLRKLPLTDMPGTPSFVGGGIAISTLDHFILRYPER